MNNISVINKDDNKIYEVYDIIYNKNGYPCFLIYKDGQWIRLKAKHFKPIEIMTEEDIEDTWSEFLSNYANELRLMREDTI